jgi:hypothetical protein
MMRVVHLTSVVQCAVVPNGGAMTATAPRPLSVEALKRGDLDADGKDRPRTIMLRFYGAFEGHTSVAAYETNLLENDAGAEAIALARTTGEGENSDIRKRRYRSGLRSAG